jgi:HEAT repeat protein
MDLEFPGFAYCFDLIRQGVATGDPGMQEDGFFWLLDQAPHYVAELLAALHAEKDPVVRARLTDLLGATGSTAVFETLAAQLDDSDQTVRMFTVLSLEELGFPAARRLADEYKAQHPDEF